MRDNTSKAAQLKACKRLEKALERIQQKSQISTELTAHKIVPSVPDGAEWRIHQNDDGRFGVEWVDERGASHETVLSENVYVSIEDAELDCVVCDREAQK